MENTYNWTKSLSIIWKIKANEALIQNKYESKPHIVFCIVHISTYVGAMEEALLFWFIFFVVVYHYHYHHHRHHHY